MEITKLSAKGQIVISEKLRQGIDVGTPFLFIRKNNSIILKEVKGLTEEEKEEMEELDKIWKEIDEGKCITMTKEEFLKEMYTW